MYVLYVCMCERMYVRTYVCVYVCMYVCVYVHMYSRFICGCVAVSIVWQAASKASGNFHLHCVWLESHTCTFMHQTHPHIQCVSIL